MFIYHTSIRNMRAHNANVRSFILRYRRHWSRKNGSAPGKKIIIIKNKYPSHKCVHRKATGNKPLSRIHTAFLFFYTHVYYIITTSETHASISVALSETQRG